MFIPVKYIITSAKSTLNGILNATTTVGLTSLRNNANTIIASIAPITILLKTLEIIFLIKSPWLLKGVIERPLYFPSNSLNESFNAFVTSLVLAVLDLYIASITESLPFIFAYWSPTLSTVTTFATSEIFMEPTPFTFVRTIFLICFALS